MGRLKPWNAPRCSTRSLPTSLLPLMVIACSFAIVQQWSNLQKALRFKLSESFHIFVHVPKTGGSEFNRLMTEQYADRNDTLCFPEYQSICCFNDYSARVRSKEFFAAFSNGKPRTCRIASSEWTYTDLHAWGALRLPRVQLSTFVRNPVMLLRSAVEHDIHFTKSFQQFNFYLTLSEKFQQIASDLTVQRGIPIQNTLAKWLLPDEGRGHYTDPSVLESFLDQNYFFIGITEYFHQSMCLFQYKLGVERDSLAKQCVCNTSNTRSGVNSRNQQQLQGTNYTAYDVIKLFKLCSVDQILYAYSLRRFFMELRDMQKNLDIDMLSCVLSTEKEHGIAAHMLEDTRVFET